ncbi:hypothetical protein [Microbacterium sp.]|uniref:hypothetical protein n=1 Tax=Microbacterium sp. TaxID=51671 RepID=UPI0033413EC0
MVVVPPTPRTAGAEASTPSTPDPAHGVAGEETAAGRYIRFQSVTATEAGINPGVFFLTGELGRAGLLAPEDERQWQTANEWYDAHCTDPSTVDPSLYTRYPRAACWFRAEAGVVLDRIALYLDILDRYGVPYERRESFRPGRVVYSDDTQVVVTP